MSDERLRSFKGSLNGIGNLSVDINSMNAVATLFQSLNPAPKDNNTGSNNTNSGNQPATPVSDKK